VSLVLKKLEKIGQEITDGPAAERPKQALQQVKDGGLHPAMETAVVELKTGKLHSAADREKKVRDQLREIARMLVLSQDVAESLRQAIQDLDRAIDEQKQTSAKTRTIENKEDSTKAETKQAEVVDSTDLIRKDMKALRPSPRSISRAPKIACRKRALCSAPARMQKRSARKRHRSRTMRSSICAGAPLLWRSNWPRPSRT